MGASRTAGPSEVRRTLSSASARRREGRRRSRGSRAMVETRQALGGSESREQVDSCVTLFVCCPDYFPGQTSSS